MYMLGTRQVNTMSVLLLCTVEIQYSLDHPECLCVCVCGGGGEFPDYPGIRTPEGGGFG